MQITVGPNPITVTALGRLVLSGNTQAHQITLVDAANSNLLGSVTVNTAGVTAGQFVYATLSSPVTLSANQVYYILSMENSGGDFWYENNVVVTTTSAAHLDYSVFESTPGGPVMAGEGPGNHLANQPYVPVDFQYSMSCINSGLI